MVRQGSVVMLAAGLVLAVAGLIFAQADAEKSADKPAVAPAKDEKAKPEPAGESTKKTDQPADAKKEAKPADAKKEEKSADAKKEEKPADAKKEEKSAAKAKAPAETVDHLPYKILAHVVVDPDTRIDARKRDALLVAWETLIDRFVGAPWTLTIADVEEGPLTTTPIESLTAESFADASSELTKVWVLRVSRADQGYMLSGREFDTETGRLGPIHRHSAPFLPDAPRALFQLALEVFAPSAVIGDRFGKNINLIVRGSSLEAASPVGKVVSVGSIFQPIRLVPLKTGKTRVMDIPFSYLRVEEVDGPVVRCSMTSILSDPLTKRIVQANTLVALGLKAGRAPTRLRFVTKPDKAPAAGYLLTARALPSGAPREVGTTDREGRIVIPAGFADGLVVLRLLAGNTEPMLEFPAMPGESPVERQIPFEPKPLTVTLETELEALRDEIIDLIALRARLEARLKARADGEKWDELEETLKEFYKLPSRDIYADRLDKIKERVTEQQTRTKVTILTKTAQSQFADVRALVDRYLDDDLIRGYAEAIKQARAQAAAEAKAEVTKKAARAKAAAATAPAATEKAAPKQAGPGAPRSSGFPTPPGGSSGFPTPPGSSGPDQAGGSPKATPPQPAAPKAAAPTKPAPPAAAPKGGGVPF